MKIAIKNFLKVSALCTIASMSFISHAMDVDLSSPKASRKKDYDPRSSFAVTLQDHKLIKKNKFADALLLARTEVEVIKDLWDQASVATGAAPTRTGKLPPKLANQALLYLIRKHSQGQTLKAQQLQFVTVENAISIDSTQIDKRIKDAAIKILVSTGIKSKDEKNLAYAAKSSDHWLLELLLRNGDNLRHKAVVEPIINNDDARGLMLLMHYGLDPFKVYPDLPYSAYVLALQKKNQSVDKTNRCVELIMQPIHSLAAQLRTSELETTKLNSDITFMIAGYVYGYYQVEPQLNALANSNNSRIN